MIGFGTLAKAIVLAGNAISTKRINTQEEKNANEHYSEQQAYLQGRANSDAMATTAARAAMGAIDASEQRSQERERNMAEVAGGTDMSRTRTKRAASEARAGVASDIHQQQQQQQLQYDQLYQQSKQAEFADRQARVAAKRQSAQNMVTNVMQLGAAGGGFEGNTPDTKTPGSVVDTNGGNATTGGTVTTTMTGGGFDADGNPIAPLKVSSVATPVKADTSGLKYQNNPYYGMSDYKARMLARRAANN